MDDKITARWEFVANLILLAIVAGVIAGLSHLVNRPMNYSFVQRYLGIFLAGAMYFGIHYFRKKRKSATL